MKPWRFFPTKIDLFYSAEKLKITSTSITQRVCRSCMETAKNGLSVKNHCELLLSISCDFSTPVPPSTRWTSLTYWLERTLICCVQLQALSGCARYEVVLLLMRGEVCSSFVFKEKGMGLAGGIQMIDLVIRMTSKFSGLVSPLYVCVSYGSCFISGLLQTMSILND